MSKFRVRNKNYLFLSLQAECVPSAWAGTGGTPGAVHSVLQSDGQDVETRLHKEEVVCELWEKVIHCLLLEMDFVANLWASSLTFLWEKL